MFTVFQWDSAIDLKTYNIQVRELYALVVAVLTFRRFWIRKKFVIQTDNSANIFAVKKGACENPLVMELLQILAVEQIRGNFSVRLEHIPTKLNTTADRLSRGEIALVQRENPNFIQLEPVWPKKFKSLAHGSYSESR